MTEPLASDALNQLFYNARTHNAWKPQELSEELIQELYDCLRWAPTSMNTNPARFLFLRTEESKKRLQPHLSPGNVDKTMNAPLTVIIASDPKFYEYLPELAPHARNAPADFAANTEKADDTRLHNATLQGGYLIVAARALGLDCGPMSGFSQQGVDAEFFSESGWRSNFLCNIGYGDDSGLRPRAARLKFEQACQIL